jgi:hypothetical protein
MIGSPPALDLPALESLDEPSLDELHRVPPVSEEVPPVPTSTWLVLTCSFEHPVTTLAASIKSEAETEERFMVPDGKGGQIDFVTRNS